MSDLKEFTDEEVEAVDQWMSDHMYGHTISNNYHSFRCDVGCRIRALGLGINQVIAKRREKEAEDKAADPDGGCCMHGHTRGEHPVCFDEEGNAR